MFADTLSWCWQ